MIAALFVETNGVYFGLPNVDPWDQYRDARFYNGPYPVVAHPPCQRWGRLAYQTQAMYGLRIGDDAKCFERAIMFVDKYGGVLEHPAESIAFKTFGVPRPLLGSWLPVNRRGTRAWITEVWQSAYGHRASKRTWLYAVTKEEPEELDWSTPRGTHEIGGKHSTQGSRPMIKKKDALATPIPFRDLLIRIAESCHGETK